MSTKLTIKKAIGWNHMALVKKTNAKNYSIRSANQQRFERAKLPDPIAYYQNTFKSIKLRGKWASVLCCFHDDHYPSLALNLETGGYKCFACGEQGSDLINFYQRLHHVDFKTAAKALGAWRAYD